MDISTLNENQRTAVLWDDGPLLVLAGPGSGKTRVLTLRIVRLLQSRDDVSLLALTFTNRAAAEMRERVDAMLGRHGDRVHLCTFHSFATDVLRQHGGHIGLRPDFALITQEEDRLAVLELAVTRVPDYGVVLPADRKALLEVIDRLLAESYDANLQSERQPHLPNWVPPLYAAYCEALLAGNQLDFGSLLVFAQRLLRANPGVVRALHAAWTHVCVDEFQDTNRAQYDLLKLIVPSSNPNLFVVGDDDQIIYQWNGASPQRLSALQQDFATHVVQLPENFRCPAQVIDIANRLISYNRTRTPDKRPLASRRGRAPDGVIRYFTFPDSDSELIWIGHDITERVITPGSVAVLARTGKLVERAAETLVANGFESHVQRRKSDFFSPAIRVVFHALRCANARHERNVLRRLCVAWESLAGRLIEVEEVAAAAALIGGDFLRAWCDLATATASGNDAALLVQIRARLVDRLDYVPLIDWFFAEAPKAWGETSDHEFGEEFAMWRQIHDAIAVEHDLTALTLNAYLHSIDLASKTSVPSAAAIRCLTVHGSKGLEFDHVYLIGMAQDILPAFHALKKGPTSREVEEERRNCFVAITRVCSTLTLTRARRYAGWDKFPSQFLREMGFET